MIDHILAPAIVLKAFHFFHRSLTRLVNKLAHFWTKEKCVKFIQGNWFLEMGPLQQLLKARVHMHWNVINNQHMDVDAHKFINVDSNQFARHWKKNVFPVTGIIKYPHCGKLFLKPQNLCTVFHSEIYLINNSIETVAIRHATSHSAKLLIWSEPKKLD